MSLEKVRTRIIELVPDIVELKYGCKTYEDDTGMSEYYVGEFGEFIYAVRD
jgi:hypothetical protein